MRTLKPADFTFKDPAYGIYLKKREAIQQLSRELRDGDVADVGEINTSTDMDAREGFVAVFKKPMDICVSEDTRIVECEKGKLIFDLNTRETLRMQAEISMELKEKILPGDSERKVYHTKRQVRYKKDPSTLMEVYDLDGEHFVYDPSNGVFVIP